MIKILFMIHDLGPGGAEKVLVNLVNNLDKTKFEVTVISLFGGGVNEQFLSKEVKYKYIFKKMIRGNSKLMLLLTPQQLHKKFIKENYDIEVSYLEGPSARIISGCRNKKTRLLSWIHVEQHTKKIASKAFRSYSESVKAYEKFDGVICVSESVKEDFCNLYPNLKKVDVLYNVNETDMILRQKNEKVSDDFFKEKEFKICGVGKLVPIKGFDKLARIHKRLIDNGYKVHTYVLGEGSERNKIENYLKKNDIEESFTLIGYQTNPYKYISKCDLFVCTSVAEGFSTAATEALILGVPVVTTPVAGMREMLGVNNEYGIICEMSEDSIFQSIKLFLDDDSYYKYYKNQAIQRGKKFLKHHTLFITEQYLEKFAKKRTYDS